MKKLLSMFAVLSLMSSFALANEEEAVKKEATAPHGHGHATKHAKKKAKKGEHTEEAPTAEHGEAAPKHE